MRNLTPTTILLASAAAPPTPGAARAASDVARWFGATLYVVHVASSLTGAPPSRVPGYCALAAAVAACTAAGGLVTRANLRHGESTAQIIAEAREIGAHVIVYGRRAGCPTDEMVTQLARCTPCPILIVRDGESGWPPRRIVIGDDGSIEAHDASVLGAIVGGAAGAEGLLLRAVPPLDTEEQRHAESQLLSHAAELADLFGRPPAAEVSAATPALALTLVADAMSGSALIVLGTCGIGAMGRHWLGSTANEVLTRTSSSVLICPRGGDAGGGHTAAPAISRAG